MKPPRGLTAEERAAWERLARTVVPLDPPRARSGRGTARETGGGGGATAASAAAAGAAAPLRQPPAGPATSPSKLGEDRGPAASLSSSHGLDSTWDRKLRAAAIEPDFTLDLHGLTLDQAHARLDSGLMQAKALGARLVLLVTGKPRPVDAADRGSKRGAIRAKVLDWLAAGPHGSDIAAIRNAHRRHGGEGALYIILKRRR